MERNGRVALAKAQRDDYCVRSRLPVMWPLNDRTIRYFARHGSRSLHAIALYLIGLSSLGALEIKDYSRLPDVQLTLRVPY